MDNVVFFSLQELTEAYFTEMTSENNIGKLGKKLVKTLREILNEFLRKMTNNEDLFENGLEETN